ncbi:hypothetical protein HY212_05015 [Candidatus Pacearchaeota archaeon]|nr:hypothetical protein [Candidatus Pacearchaeota archaeon]
MNLKHIIIGGMLGLTAFSVASKLPTLESKINEAVRLAKIELIESQYY